MIGLPGLPWDYRDRLAGEQRWLVRQAFLFWRGTTPSFDASWTNVVRFLREDLLRARPEPPPPPPAVPPDDSWAALVEFLERDRREPDPPGYVVRYRRVHFRWPLEDP